VKIFNESQCFDPPLKRVLDALNLAYRIDSADFKADYIYFLSLSYYIYLAVFEAFFSFDGKVKHRNELIMPN